MTDQGMEFRVSEVGLRGAKLTVLQSLLKDWWLGKSRPKPGFLLLYQEMVSRVRI